MKTQEELAALYSTNPFFPILAQIRKDYEAYIASYNEAAGEKSPGRKAWEETLSPSSLEEETDLTNLSDLSWSDDPNEVLAVLQLATKLVANCKENLTVLYNRTRNVSSVPVGNLNESADKIRAAVTGVQATGMLEQGILEDFFEFNDRGTRNGETTRSLVLPRLRETNEKRATSDARANSTKMRVVFNGELQDGPPNEVLCKLLKSSTGWKDFSQEVSFAYGNTSWKNSANWSKEMVEIGGNTYGLTSIA